jgi:hypothetical protein
MSLGKRLFIGEAAAAAPVGSETLDVFGDGSCLALYTLDYDASDAGGNHDGTPNDVTFGVDGQINWGASFNGSSSYVEISTSNTGLTLYDRTNYSISLWFYTSDVTASSRVFSQEDPSGSVIAIRTDDFYIDTRDEGGSPVATSFNSSSNAWNHAVLTYDGTTYKLYLNGNQTPDATYTHSLYPKHATASGVVMALGARRTGGTSAGSFNGKLDQLRIFDRAISPTEVSTLYGETATTYTPTTDTIHYQGTNAAHYKLDGNANDETTNYDGAESNITYDFGRYGTAAVFDGSSSDIEISKSVFGTGDGTADVFTISLWFNTATNNGVLAGTRGNSNTQGFILWLLSDGTIRYDESNATASIDTLITTNTYDDGNWHNVVVTRNASNQATLYVDGSVQVSTTTITTALTSHTNNLFIGRYTGGSLYYDGLLDQVRIYNSALNATAVQNLYNEKQAYITKNASDPFGDNNEVAFYELENNANDSTGSNTGAASNVTFTSGSGLFGTYAAYFNGSTSNIQVDTLPSITNYNFTFSFWLKTTDTVGYAIDFRDPIYITIGTGLFAGGASGMGIYDGTNSYSIENTAMQTINDGNWYHIVMTHDGTSLKGYLDGNIIGTVSTGTTTQSPGGTNHNRIGQRGDGSTSYAFQGSIDQVRIFDRALDGDEVFKLYAEVIN